MCPRVSEWVEIGCAMRCSQVIIIYGAEFSISLWCTFFSIHSNRGAARWREEEVGEVDGKMPIELDTGKWRSKLEKRWTNAECRLNSFFPDFACLALILLLCLSFFIWFGLGFVSHARIYWVQEQIFSSIYVVFIDDIVSPMCGRRYTGTIRLVRLLYFHSNSLQLLLSLCVWVNCVVLASKQELSSFLPQFTHFCFFAVDGKNNNDEKARKKERKKEQTIETERV